MTDVCVTAPPPAIERYTSFSIAAAGLGLPSDALLNQFAGAGADQGTQGIMTQILNLPKENQPEYIRKFNYTGTDYTEIVQEAASCANEFFGSNVEFFSADGSLVLDPDYTEYLVNAAISAASNFAVPYELAAAQPDAVRDAVETELAQLKVGVEQLSGAACIAEYPFNDEYSGLLNRCAAGDTPVYPWFSGTNARFIKRVDGNFDGIPLECSPGEKESCGLFQENPNPMNGDYVSLGDIFFLDADKAAALGEDANCYIETYIVEDVVAMVAGYLPFCGSGSQNLYIHSAMMGYYFGKTGGKYCKGQSKEAIVDKMVTVHSMCDNHYWSHGWYAKPCSVLFKK